MSPLQETANAFSMLVPLSASCWYRYVLHAAPFPSDFASLLAPPDLLIATTALHLPFSFIYHLRCALNYYPNQHLRIHNNWRRLDHTFIHVCCAAFSYALSGSGHYLLLTAFMNAFCVKCVWFDGVTSAGKPLQQRLQPMIQLYISCILWRGDFVNYGLAFATGLGASLLFMLSKQLKGWGHSIFHVVGGPLTTTLVRAASLVDVAADNDKLFWPFTCTVFGGAVARTLFKMYDDPKFSGTRRKFRTAIFETTRPGFTHD